ncbi:MULTISPECIES: 4-hydroxy-tetrahydrodipicolinate reductase [unclassified Parafrankia]|uniref:4-hydroxy-tetrahydrodipicolinate reductase n=1 Tax=unclassified Parafrankia TaxID=2994368 RepID=UPI000DD4CC63|nr:MULTISPECIES: 4-hydroxy-tetrahydrodipicolinate reductase [unclassified Parafrankia]TCJ30701.1 4-hydroxy-tetrahydrodipicolinate reductase [Parafrankia sp. BMG5.11]
MTQVAVLGARGRMGEASVRAIEATSDMSVVAEIDVDDNLREIVEKKADVVLVFSPPGVAHEQVQWCIEQGIHVVVGTSGFDEDAVQQIRAALIERDEVNVFVVPNFSVGAVLLTQFAAKAAPLFESVEIIEMHHPDKVDAPSGTAQHTAELIARARAKAGSAPSPDATSRDPHGTRGGRIEEVNVHAVRVRGFMSSQEVLFGSEGEILRLRYDSVTRESLMPGVLAALRAVPGLPGVTIGLETVLSLG